MYSGVHRYMHRGGSTRVKVGRPDDRPIKLTAARACAISKHLVLDELGAAELYSVVDLAVRRVLLVVGRVTMDLHSVVLTAMPHKGYAHIG